MSPPSKKKSSPIDSIEKLQRRLPVILNALNEDPALFLAAAANPSLAIEEIGYEVSEEFRPELERHLRFPEITRKRLKQLQSEIYKAASCEFQVDDPDELHRVLFDVLDVSEPGDETRQIALEAALMQPTRDQLTTRPKPAVFGHQHADPLDVLEGAHPVMKPLLEYRRLEASEPRFAVESLYRRIRQGDVKLPITRLQARIGHERNRAEEQ